MTLPRALCGTVRAMARPARPLAEIAAVKAAAAIVRAETGAKSNTAIARKVAARVVAAVIADLKRDPSDELTTAMAAVERRLLSSPFVRLATCPEIDTASLYIRRRVIRYTARFSRFITQQQDHLESADISIEVTDALAKRYLKYLRN